MDNFKSHITQNFNFLLTDGFSFSNEIDNDYKDFVVILEKNGIRLRFVQDRVDFALGIGSTQDPKIWHDFYKIMWWSKNNNYIEGLKASNKLDALKRDLKKHLELIQKLFCADNYL